MPPYEDEQDSEDITHYKFGFSLDKDGFFRGACSKCGLHFKMKVDADDLGDLLSPAFKQIERDYNIILAASSDEPDEGTQTESLGCPYCGQADHPSNMLTEEFSRYFLRWAQRELVYPKIKGFYDELERIFNQPSSSHSRGFFSIETRFEHDEVTIPIRPISGPEIPDMVPVDLRCCAESIKITEGWSDKIYCPFCFTELILL